MAREVFYFSHDTNARNDEKIITLRMKLGAEGYGIYFMLLERLTESAGYTCSTNYDILAFDLRVDATLIRQVVEEFDLFSFTEDKSQFWSEYLTERMASYERIREQRRKAGLKSGENRRKKSTAATDDEQLSNGCPTKNEQRREENEEKRIEEKERLSDESTNKKEPDGHPSPTSDYEKFQEWLRENAPFCANKKNFPKQISESQFRSLKEKYTGSQIAEIATQLENRKDLRKRYSDLYQTLKNWLKKEYDTI